MGKKALQSGGVLLVALVLLAVILVFLSAVSGLIITQRHNLVQNVRSAQAFHAADGGFEYTLSLLNNKKCTPEKLLNQPFRQPLIDIETGKEMGAFSISTSQSQGKIIVTAIGETLVPQTCHAIAGVFTLRTDYYEILWQSLGKVVCPIPVPQSKPSCA